MCHKNIAQCLTHVSEVNKLRYVANVGNFLTLILEVNTVITKSSTFHLRSYISTFEILRPDLKWHLKQLLRLLLKNNNLFLKSGAQETKADKLKMVNHTDI